MDVSNASIVIVFIRYVEGHRKVDSRYLGVSYRQQHPKTYDGILKILDKAGLDYKKNMVARATYGASVMRVVHEI